jgi:hypothetical protein
MFFISIVFPNTQQIMYRYRPALETYKGGMKRLQKRWLEWRPTMFWLIFISLLFIVSISRISRESEFLYFNF